MPENPTIDFRAPPPSPVASGRRSCFTNEDVLADFLEHSLRVPDLILPDKIFPQHKFSDTPPAIDFASFNPDSFSKALDSIGKIGCFQLVNCGISGSAFAEAVGLFRLPPDKRKAVARSPEKPYGFEVRGEEESELSEEFVWCGDQRFGFDMEGIWPVGYSNFSHKMEVLGMGMEKVAEKILGIFLESSMKGRDMIMQSREVVGSICCVYKHRKIIGDDEWMRSLRYDVIRMLIKGSDHSHALSFHICDGFREFHVYSKRGWLSFSPLQGAIVVTIGDQIQEMSGGKYKQVIGRPIYKGGEKCISMAVLYSPPPTPSNASADAKEKTISVGQQVMIGLTLTLAYQFLAFIYNKLC